MSALLLAAGSKSRVATGLSRFFHGLAAAVVREYRTRREISFLRQQDDRTLHDLGINRSEVERAVRGWFR